MFTNKNQFDSTCDDSGVIFSMAHSLLAMIEILVELL